MKSRRPRIRARRRKRKSALHSRPFSSPLVGLLFLSAVVRTLRWRVSDLIPGEDATPATEAPGAGDEEDAFSEEAFLLNCGNGNQSAGQSGKILAERRAAALIGD
ncbi:hypothetical protein MTO96_003736 [Rhipicephalus appendiculatus]